MNAYHIERDAREPAHLRVQFVFDVNNPGSTTTELVYLPEWRPGRYELGHFSRNVRRITCTTPEGTAIRVERADRSSWKVHHGGAPLLHITYLYRADQPDAGGCYADDQLLYINPIHCCLYTHSTRSGPITITMKVPANWEVACGLPHTDGGWTALDYDELVDMPLLASPRLHHRPFRHRDIQFQLSVHAQTPPPMDRYEADIRRIVDAQIQMMGPLPVNDYHFILLTLPYAHYHGVEHRNSTMMVLGPEPEVFRGLYPELLGLSSHEFFHTWNIKHIKPVDLIRYDYQRENYSSLGYVFEGFTTYYGDLFLLRSGLFGWQEYAHEVDVYLSRHLVKYGRDNASLRDSGRDTWVDGYGGPAAPHRSVSIYAEGMLSALCLDLEIRRCSRNRCSLDDLMRHLLSMANRGEAYDESDMVEFLSASTGHPFLQLFGQLYHRPITLTENLNNALEWVGCGLQPVACEDRLARACGLRLQGGDGAQLVVDVAPGSASDRAGLRLGDRVTGHEPMKDQWRVRWTDRMLTEHTCVLHPDPDGWFDTCRLIHLPTRSPIQEKNYRLWVTGLPDS